jgi:hypothetical protein
MGKRPELEEVCRHLEDLAAVVASGRHERLAERAGETLGPCRAALETLAREARAGRDPGALRDACLRIRSRLARLHALLDHAGQVRAGLTGVIALLYEENTGAQYSRGGEPRLAPPPRIQAEA